MEFRVPSSELYVRVCALTVNSELYDLSLCNKLRFNAMISVSK
jgi:hypothetical protein